MHDNGWLVKAVLRAGSIPIEHRRNSLSFADELDGGGPVAGHANASGSLADERA
jgi:hypothetical protein